MKNAKILIAVLLALLSSAALSAQDFTTKTLYRTGVYGQTFELIELSELPTAYYIFSKNITNSKEY